MTSRLLIHCAVVRPVLKLVLTAACRRAEGWNDRFGPMRVFHPPSSSRELLKPTLIRHLLRESLLRKTLKDLLDGLTMGGPPRVSRSSITRALYPVFHPTYQKFLNPRSMPVTTLRSITTSSPVNSCPPFRKKKTWRNAFHGSGWPAPKPARVAVLFTRELRNPMSVFRNLRLK